jgi:membrane-associated phospholipid phosphatase
MLINSPTPLLALLRRYWLPLLSSVLLVVVCSDNNPVDGRDVAKLLSGPVYKYTIGFSFVLFVVTAWRHRSWAPLRAMLELTLLCLLFTNLLKYGTGLPRPPRLHNGMFDPTAFSPGFPSAHTAFACGLAWLIWQINPRLAIPWFGIAVAIGWSRVELNAHYPYQVWFGALLGIALGILISRCKNGVLSAFRKKYSARRIALKATVVACFAQISELLSIW